MFTKKLLEMWFKVTKASSPISAVIDLTFMAAAANERSNISSPNVSITFLRHLAHLKLNLL